MLECENNFLEKQDIRISKFLSLVLRHNPEFYITKQEKNRRSLSCDKIYVGQF